eukprot:g16858.t1
MSCLPRDIAAQRQHHDIVELLGEWCGSGDLDQASATQPSAFPPPPAPAPSLPQAQAPRKKGGRHCSLRGHTPVPPRPPQIDLNHSLYVPLPSCYRAPCPYPSPGAHHRFLLALPDPLAWRPGPPWVGFGMAEAPAPPPRVRERTPSTSSPYPTP